MERAVEGSPCRVCSGVETTTQRVVQSGVYLPHNLLKLVLALAVTLQC